ncbi:IPT/TIG domain-containing protein [Hamadaea tsunoensis]|uniref:IPT/TIG domain-containing protein n=1 Tax=Hamadaea tsunoensis TaxID=53368 RepID=UPI0004085C78|nr:IPT/TIG domain-containing protein [Hamadaea tsunoensis]
MRSRPLIIGLIAALCAMIGITVLPPSAYADPLPEYLGYGWGHETGDGSGLLRTAPAALSLPGGASFAAVSGGTHSSLALGSDGQVYGWGDNSYGGLGDATGLPHHTPVAIPLPGGVSAVAVAAGNESSYAIGDDGHLYAWGYNSQGDLGDGTTTDRSTPGVVPLPAGVRAVAVTASGAHTAFAIGDDGHLYGWGFNTSGQVGDGSTMNRTTPVPVTLPGGVAVKKVSAANDATAALGTDGHIYTWGLNFNGILGNGTGETFYTPHRISLPDDIGATDIAMNFIAGFAVGSDAHVYGWGSNGYRQLGNDRPGNFFAQSPVPVDLPGGALAAAVSTGESNTHAIGVDGSLYGWGENSGGLVGDGTTTQRTSAVRVPLPDDAAVAAVSDGSFATLAVASVQPRPPRFVSVAPDLVVPAGAHFTSTFLATGHPAPVMSLAAGAPSWLSVDAHSGVVSGTVPAGVTGFTFAVTAVNSLGSVTTLPSTVAVGQTVAVTGHVTADGGPVADAAVEACGGGICTTATTDAAGAYSVGALAGASIRLTAAPPPAQGRFPRTLGPLTVPPLGLSGQHISLHDLYPIADGVAFPDLPTNPTAQPWINWSRPTTVSVQGCAHGVAIAAVVGADTSSQLAFTPTMLTESPAGSGTYTGVLPALYPMHGAARIRSRVICLPDEALEPSTGPATGGGAVTLGGTGFTGATAVRFGGTPASFSVADDSLIQATAPAGTGTVSVTVTPAGGGTDIVVGNYTYEAVTAVSPASGAGAGGTVVTITGTGLANTTGVTFGGVPADYTQLDAEHVQAVSPPGSGTQDIQVETLAGRTPVTAGDRFAYTGGGATALSGRRPALTAVTRPAGKAPAVTSAATRAVVRATALPPPLTPGDNLVKYGRGAVFLLAGKIIDMISQAKLDAVKRDLAANNNCETRLAVKKAETEQSYDTVTKLAAAGLSAVIYTAVTATLVAGPLALLAIAALIAAVVFGVGKGIANAIADFVAEALAEKCKGTVTPADSNLFIDPSGTVQDTNGNPVAGASVTLLRASEQTGPFTAVPAGDPGIQPGTNPQTTAADGVFHWDVLSGFYEIRAAAPGCTDPADPANASVTIGPFAVPPPRVGLSIVLACAGEPPAAVPAVTALSSGTGTTAGGDTVTVTGTGFTPAATVAFGGTPAASVTYLSPQLLSVVTPAGSGPVDITVHTAGGTSPTGDADRYFFGTAPVVAGLSSSQGIATGGVPLTVTGSGFTGTTAVTFGGQPATGLAVVSDTELHVTVPPGVPGTVDVTVTNPAGSSAPTAADRYAYTGSAPVFTSGSSAAFTAGTGGSFTPTASGTPTPAVTVTGTLPSGVTFTGGVLTVGPSAVAGTAHFTFVAANGVGGQVAQPFTLTVNPAPTGTAPSIDTKVTGTGMNVATAKITPTVAGELLVAYVAADGPSANNQPQSATVTSNRGITWTLVRRTNTQHGTAEIWTARAPATLNQITVTSTLGRTVYNQQVTVVAYTNAGGVGASAGANATTGAPTVGLTTTAAKSWVFAVGNDWDRSVNRTPAAGQTIQAQGTDSAGDTYWVQSTAAATAAAGTVVTIGDTAPADDRWNLSAVEILGLP